ncbi:pilin [Candidatus Parcubacteria bacterium]|nr:pilin [Candidatus Parcubacteria bacterium]
MKPFRLVLLAFLFVPSLAFAQVESASSTASSTPTCSLIASPTTIQAGGSFTLRWTSVNATAGNITGLGPVGPSGQANLVAPLTAETRFTGTFTGPGGTGQCQTTIRTVHDNPETTGSGSGSTGSGGVGSGGETCTGSTCSDSTGATAPVVPVTSNPLPPPGGSEIQTQTGGLVPCTGINCNLCAAGRLIQNIINFMIGISIPLAALLFAWAGALYWSSGASPGNKDRAKHIFTDAIIGFVIAIAAFLIVQTILKVLFQDRYQNWSSIQCVSDSQRPGVGYFPTLNELLQSVLPSLAPAPSPGPVTYGGGGYLPTGADPYSGGTLTPNTDNSFAAAERSYNLSQCESGNADACATLQNADISRGDIAGAAAAYYGENTSEGPDGGNKACAWAVNNILEDAGIAKIDGDSVRQMELELQRGRGDLVTDWSQSKAGDIVVFGGMSHVGICEDNGCTNVLSNSSGKASFTSEYPPTPNSRIYSVRK